MFRNIKFKFQLNFFTKLQPYWIYIISSLFKITFENSRKQLNWINTNFFALICHDLWNMTEISMCSFESVVYTERGKIYCRVCVCSSIWGRCLILYSIRCKCKRRIKTSEQKKWVCKQETQNGLINSITLCIIIRNEYNHERCKKLL